MDIFHQCSYTKKFTETLQTIYPPVTSNADQNIFLSELLTSGISYQKASDFIA